jgi:hypothetical protein
MYKPGWKRLKYVANGRQSLNRLIQQATLTWPKKYKVYSFGINFASNVDQAVKLIKQIETRCGRMQ